MTAFLMPSLGADMDEGTLLEWLVKPGDVVHRGDIMAVVDTAKSAVEVETFHDGVVGELVVEPGQTVPVGAMLATFAGEPPAGTTSKPAPAPAPVVANQPEPEPVVTSPLVRRLAAERRVTISGLHPSGPGGKVHRADLPVARSGERGRLHASPLARRLAREAGLDLEMIEGTGRDGVVQAKDVRARLAGVPAAATPVEAAPAAKPAVGTNQHPKMRQTIAALMERANREIPQYYLSTTIDMHAAVQWLHEKNRSLPVDQRLVPAALVMHAVARAAVKVPQLNGEWRDGGFVPSDKVNLGLVTSLRGGGVLVPVIENASELSVAETMSELKSAVQRARTGRLRASELTGASITVTSLGEQGVEAVYGVVFPPQVAIVGVGAVVERPWARDGLLGVRPVVTVTLAADHRASDGAVGARLLNLVDELLQHPEA